MKITSYTGGFVSTNGYFVECEGGNILIDAPAGVSAWLKKKSAKISAVYLTHQHYDHVEDVAILQKEGITVYAFAEYSKDLTLETYGASWGLPSVAPYRVDECLKVGEREIAGMRVEIAHVPGHSTDSVTFFFKEEEVLFSGDALFEGSVGRCDLPGGSFESLLAGIKRELLPLPDATQVYPGHGGFTSIGKEKRSNGYLRSTKD